MYLMKMEDRIVLITGAKGGLGSFVTESFLATGATVVGSSRSIQQSDFNSPRFTAMAVDFADADAVQKMVEQIISRFGKIDVLAHIMGGFAAGAIVETDEKTWMQMLDMNLISAFHALRAVVPPMRRAKYGRIVAVGSLTATEPHAGLGAYVVSKTALATLVQTVALENADANITANVVLPGTMDTPANRAAMPKADFSKWLQPNDVASLILKLTDESSGLITGTLVPIQAR
jgi:NAD(P)-dependent dehydrogenase (short-subunit alcohol dehydrogenase family)